MGRKNIVSEITTKEDMDALYAYMDKHGVDYSVNTNPSPELIAEIKAKIVKADELRYKISNRKISKSIALGLLYKAYESGEFDEIINHLENAKNLK